jgi:23S rRNA pseudouridine955/2504/2580 synthase
MVQVDEYGKQAISHFRPITHFRNTTLVEVTLETGRTHQIRVHAASIGHPLAGDKKYGDGGCNQEMKLSGLRRLFLHAHVLAFTLPGTHQDIHVSAPLPTELQTLLNTMEEK